MDLAGLKPSSALAASGSIERPRPLETILVGGLVVAALDIANAMTFWGLYRGTTPQAILQSIAAGLLGKDAFTGGAPTAWLGAFLHLFIACAIASVYCAACLLLPGVLARPATYGPLYGAAVYLFMNQLVIPLSRIGATPFILPWFLANFIGHVLLVGPPVAFIARWSARRGAARGSGPAPAWGPR
jgi:uncharacterized membrane protein YagU involved in acid resistance